MSSALENRYGVAKEKRPLPSWFWYAVAAVAVVLGTAFVAWAQSDDAAKPVARDVGFSLTSENEGSVTFELVKRPEDTVVCAVKALNQARAPIGWKEHEVGVLDESVSVQTVSLRTLSEATTITVDSCWLAE